jgi:hypothetical protein
VVWEAWEHSGEVQQVRLQGCEDVIKFSTASDNFKLGCLQWKQDNSIWSRDNEQLIMVVCVIKSAALLGLWQDSAQNMRRFFFLVTYT